MREMIFLFVVVVALLCVKNSSAFTPHSFGACYHPSSSSSSSFSSSLIKTTLTTTTTTSTSCTVAFEKYTKGTTIRSHPSHRRSNSHVSSFQLFMTQQQTSPSSSSSSPPATTKAAETGDAAAAAVSTTTETSFTTTTSVVVPFTPTATALANDETLGPLASSLVRLGLVLFIASVCIVLPMTLLPQAALFHLGLISRRRKELWAWKTGQASCKWLFWLIPFVNIDCQPAILPENDTDTPDHDPNQPCVWVCNHTSMLDVFILLAADAKLRGGNNTKKNKSNNSNLHRPIKVVYWKQLEDNFVTKLLFRQAGFLSVDMAANGHGQANEYDKRTFKTLLTQCKQALQQDKFDIGILPEGQLNPNTAQGLLPIFPGAFTLAKLCHTPIGMMALHGIDQVWHPLDGLVCRQRTVRVRCYPYVRPFTSADEFVQTFTHVVGHFGAVGQDVDDWQAWMKGTLWKERQDELLLLQQQQQQQQQPEAAPTNTVTVSLSSTPSTSTTTTTTDKD